MLDKVRFLKKYILDLEVSAKECDSKNFYFNLAAIKTALEEIENEFKSSMDTIGEVLGTDNINIEIGDDYKASNYERFGIDLDVEYNPATGTVLKASRNFIVSKINQIKFVYKPVDRKDVYEGNYLEHFSKQRTEQLMKAKSINNHNEFWKQYQIVKGNIYGSVPQELISDDGYRDLLKMGWKIVNVNIYDFGIVNVDVDELINYCDENYEHYILVFEEETRTHMLLEYII